MSSTPDAAAAAAAPWVIEPQRTGLQARAAEFWRYRRVLWFLGSRSVTDRYKGTALGMFWLFARPLIPMLIAAFVFGRLLSLPSDGIPYILFFMTGLVPWSLFDRSIMFGTKSLDQYRGLIKKLYFPRLIAPCASMAPVLVDALVYLGILIAAGLFFWWKDGVLYLKAGPTVLLAVAMAVLCLLSAMAVVLWTCVLQTRYRDVRFTMRYVLQFWMYISPIYWPLSAVPPEHRWLLYVNPLGSVVATFRWALTGVGELPLVPLASSIGVVAIALIAGLWFFTVYESSTIDRL
jgi:lipopolysaccharide transport system permease protein